MLLDILIQTLLFFDQFKNLFYQNDQREALCKIDYMKFFQGMTA